MHSTLLYLNNTVLGVSNRLVPYFFVMWEFGGIYLLLYPTTVPFPTNISQSPYLRGIFAFFMINLWERILTTIANSFIIILR